MAQLLQSQSLEQMFELNDGEKPTNLDMIEQLEKGDIAVCIRKHHYDEMIMIEKPGTIQSQLSKPEQYSIVYGLYCFFVLYILTEKAAIRTNDNSIEHIHTLERMFEKFNELLEAIPYIKQLFGAMKHKIYTEPQKFRLEHNFSIFDFFYAIVKNIIMIDDHFKWFGTQYNEFIKCFFRFNDPRLAMNASSISGLGTIKSLRMGSLGSNKTVSMKGPIGHTIRGMLASPGLKPLKKRGGKSRHTKKRRKGTYRRQNKKN